MIKRAKDELFVFSGPLASAANGLITYARMSGNHYNTEGRHLIHICELAETLNINPDTALGFFHVVKSYQCNVYQ